MVLAAQGKYEEAIPFLRDGIVHSFDKSVEGKLMEKYLAVIAECFKEINQPDSAFHYAQMGFGMTTARLKNQVASLKSELGIRYETEQKML